MLGEKRNASVFGRPPEPTQPVPETPEVLPTPLPQQLEAKKAHSISVDTIKATIHDSENRICTLLYKLTVEVDIMAHIIARHFGGDHFSLRDLRRYAVDEVNKTNGQIKFSDALETQRQMLLEEETEW